MDEDLVGRWPKVEEYIFKDNNDEVNMNVIVK